MFVKMFSFFYAFNRRLYRDAVFFFNGHKNTSTNRPTQKSDCENTTQSFTKKIFFYFFFCLTESTYELLETTNISITVFVEVCSFNGWWMMSFLINDECEYAFCVHLLRVCFIWDQCRNGRVANSRVTKMVT